MAEKLRAKGAKVVEMDLTRTDVSYAVTEAFRCGRIVLACATYDGFLFPPMENLLAKSFFVWGSPFFVRTNRTAS